MMLQACLGLTIDGWSRALRIEKPRLPLGIDRLTVRGLALGSASVDLTFQRVGPQGAGLPGRCPWCETRRPGGRAADRTINLGGSGWPSYSGLRRRGLRNEPHRRLRYCWRREPK